MAVAVVSQTSAMLRIGFAANNSKFLRCERRQTQCFKRVTINGSVSFSKLATKKLQDVCIDCNDFKAKYSKRYLKDFFYLLNDSPCWHRKAENQRIAFE